MRKRLARVARRYRGATAAVDRVVAARYAHRVASSGLLDLAWYSELTGLTFESPRRAAAHYISVGRRQGLVPNPLFDPSRWRSGNWRSGVLDPVVHYLRRSGSISPSALFDPVRYLLDHPEARSHPGGPLGHFLSSVPAPPLPVTDAALTPLRAWEDIHPDLIAVAARWRNAAWRARPRRTADHDAALGRQILAVAVARPLPQSPDDRPLVSVILPARDREVEIQRALGSVLAQSLGSWEALVVDDGSTDSTPDVVERFAAADARVRLIRRPPLGVSSARNAGIAAARGHYVAFLDSDNLWVPDFLRAMLSEMSLNDADAAYSAVELDDGRDVWVRNFEGDLEDIRYRNYIDLNALVVRRALLDEIGAFDETLRRMVDWDLAIRIAQAASIGHYPFVGVHYDDKPSGSRITTRESGSWADAVIAKHEVDWISAEAALDERTTGRVSVVVVGGEPAESTVRTVRSVLDSCGDADVEVVVVGTGPIPFFWVTLIASVGGDPRLRTVSLDQPVNRSVSRNLGATRSTGEMIMFLDPGLTLEPGWVTPLLDEMGDPSVVGAQALVLSSDGTVRSAGVESTGGFARPRPVLAGAPAERLTERARVPIGAGSPAALLMRARTVTGIRGFDPVLSDGWADLDFCLRAAEGRASGYVLRTDVRATQSVDPSAVPPPEEVRDRGNRLEFARRWDIDVDALLAGSASQVVSRLDAPATGSTRGAGDRRSAP